MDIMKDEGTLRMNPLKLTVHPIATLWLALLAIILMGGCAPISVKPMAQPSQDAQRQLAQVLETGTPEQVAQARLDYAAQLSGAQRAQQEMLAIESLIDAGLIDEAGRLIAPLAHRQEDWARLDYRRATLLSGLGLLQEGELVRALNTVQNVPVPLSMPETIRRLVLLAEIYQRLDLPVDAIRQLVALDSLLEGEAAERNREALWQALIALPPTTLRTAIDTYSEQTMQGWLSLALLYKTEPNQLYAWRLQHRDHPAVTTGFLDRLIPQKPLLTAIGDQSFTDLIAVILPEHGRFKHIGQSIRLGMESTLALHIGPVPQVRYFDGGDTVHSFEQALFEALSQRPSIIIGPLLKPQLEVLTRLPAGSPPVLALNIATDDLLLPLNVIEYALSPEQDARAAAKRMIEDGHYRALMLSADTELGQRMASAFESEFTLRGGTLVDQRTYSESETDFREQIQPLLRSRSLGGRRYNPVIRSDVDAIFVAATPSLIVQLVPQLDYHGAEKLPRYSTSLIYDGIPNAQVDKDKNGLIIPVSPLLLAAQSEPDDPRYIRYEQALLSGYPRLFAFGADAMLVALHLDELRNGDWLEGQTGKLRLSGTQVIEREPAWGQFENGVLRPLDGFSASSPIQRRITVPHLKNATNPGITYRSLEGPRNMTTPVPSSSEVPVFSDRAPHVIPKR